MLSVIALCDIEEDSYGKVYYMGKVYIIKNPECQNIKKGEVVRIEKRRLEGERLVPERI
jgi:ribosomal protein S17